MAHYLFLSFFFFGRVLVGVEAKRGRTGGELGDLVRVLPSLYNVGILLFGYGIEVSMGIRLESGLIRAEEGVMCPGWMF